MYKIGFEMTGDMSWHFHCGAWTVPFQMGVKLNIPLLIMENTAYRFSWSIFYV